MKAIQEKIRNINNNSQKTLKTIYLWHNGLLTNIRYST